MDKSKYRCYYLGCGNNKLNSPNKRFFKIPPGSENLKIWLTCMGRLDLETAKPPKTLHNTIRVCADHFEVRYFTSTLRTRLHCGAVPIRTTFQNKAIKQEHCYDYLPEESEKSQQQSSREHTEEQYWYGDSYAGASSWSATPHYKYQNIIGQNTLSETTARNSDTQNSLHCSQSVDELDAVDHLFLSRTKTVKSFSPHCLIETKREIANIILKQEQEEEEEDQLEEELGSPQATIKIEEIV